MKGNVFFDTNVLVYLFDKSEKKKHAIAGQLFKQSLEKYNPWISIQVINEFIVIATRKIKNPLSLILQRHFPKNASCVKKSL
jgi:predicted nucleic acid-binding protein